MIKVNGETIDIDQLLLKDFLSQHGYAPQHIAVEINGEIVPKSQYETKLLMSGDTLEIVRFVGGG
ncbi:thiamine biosynthesis protein ThiS [Clostridia bacterium]|nr:thiamine biosynthesis protein ThiS [Clostridia bacterium]